MKKQILILTLIVALLLVASIFLVLFNSVITGAATNVQNSEVKFDYTWTTAICDGNECRDYEIVCLNGEVIKMDVVSRVVVFSDWEDSREEKELCEN